jgi:hypothetical protein
MQERLDGLVPAVASCHPGIDHHPQPSSSQAEEAFDPFARRERRHCGPIASLRGFPHRHHDDPFAVKVHRSGFLCL